MKENISPSFSETCPPGDTIHKSVMKVRTHGILTDRRALKRNHVVTEEILVRFEAFTASAMKNAIFWDVTS
jgi:hypothetical protein